MARKKSLQSYENVHRGRLEASAREYNNPYPVETVNNIDWDDPEYAIIPDDPRWILPPTIDIGASEWYQNELTQEEQVKIGMYRIADIILTGAQFEMALNMGIFSGNMDLDRNFDDVRYSHHEAVEESHHIMMFLELIRQMKPEMTRLGIKPQGGPNWFKNAAPLVTLVSRALPLGFWQVVLTGEEPIDRMQRSLRDYDKDLEDQGITEGRIHPLVRKVMDVHIKEEARHIGYANDYMEKRLAPVEDSDEAGKKRVSKFGRWMLAGTTPALYALFARIILKPSKQALKDMNVPDDVADATWWEDEHAQETYHSFFRNALRRMDTNGLRDGEVKSKIGKAACRLFGIEPKKAAA